jgi:hypothetical protein
MMSVAEALRIVCRAAEAYANGATLERVEEIKRAVERLNDPSSATAKGNQ